MFIKRICRNKELSNPKIFLDPRLGERDDKDKHIIIDL
jgi:hypothetical protein